MACNGVRGDLPDLKPRQACAGNRQQARASTLRRTAAIIEGLVGRGPPWGARALEAFLVSTGIVALAEVGDKTQLLSFVLAARYRQPLQIVLGILAATLLNHALAGALGTLITGWLGPQTLRWVLGGSFLAMAAWVLIPDRLDEGETRLPRLGVFGATLVAFFLAEMGDKTQVATVALAARYAAFGPVVIGTTMGMMAANAPAVLFGERISRRVPVHAVHRIAAAVFAVLGVSALLGGADALFD